MPRKPLAETESDTDRRNRPEVADQQLAGAVRDSTHQIWLAGLGAFAKAQQEGTKVFEALVKEGSELQRRTLAASGDRLGDVTERVARVAEDFSRQATQSWDRLEQVFEDRVSRALGRLGVPSTRDIRELTDLLNALNEKVAALGEAGLRQGAKASDPLKRGAAKAAKAGKAVKAVRAAKAAGAKPAQ